MHSIVESVIRQLTQTSDLIESVYLYGSLVNGRYHAGESDVNLVAVVKDDYDVHQLRAVFRPIWAEHGSVLRRVPLIARQATLERHLQLNPVLAYHLAGQAEVVYGRSLFQPSTTEEPQEELCAWLSAKLMQTSGLLAKSLLDEEERQQLESLLRRLAWRFLGESAPIHPSEATIPQLLAYLYAYLDTQLNELPIPDYWDTSNLPEGTALLPGLQAIYRRGNKIVFVFAELPSAIFWETDWDKLAQDIAGEYAGLFVVTAPQLRLALRLEAPLDVRLRSYTHEWGLEPVREIQPARWHVLRQAARMPSKIEIDDLPNTYLVAEEERFGRIIHDFQNRMLNIQLEHELLCRLRLVPRFVPPSPLPTPSAPPLQRISAIFQHFGWWADYYAQEMMTDDAD